MHGAATAMGTARLLAEQLGHDGLRRDATANGIAMLPVVGIHIVCRLQTLAEADDGRFFAEIEVAIASDTGFGIHFARFLLKATNEQHLVVVVEQGIAIFPWRDGGLCLLADSCSALRIHLLFACRVQEAPDPFLIKGGKPGSLGETGDVNRTMILEAPAQAKQAHSLLRSGGNAPAVPHYEPLPRTQGTPSS